MLQNEKSKEELLAEIDSLRTTLANEKILYQSILNNINNLFWVVDYRTLTLVYFNNAFRDFITIRANMSIDIGIHIHEFPFFNRYRQKWHVVLKKILEVHHATIELAPFSNQEKFRFNLYHFNYSKFDSYIFILGQEISPNKNNDDKRKHIDLYENAIEGFFKTTIDAQIININQTAWKILGYCQDDIRKINVRKDIWVNPEERDQMISTLLTNSNKFQTIQTQLRKKDGNTLWVSIKCQITVENESTYIEGSFIDISSLKLQEHETLRQNKDLKRYQEIAISRELRMVELKKEINELLFKLGLEKKYPFIQ